MEYDRPFIESDFRGYFQWTSKFSKKLKDKLLYHACHYNELKKYLKLKRLTLRSKWSIEFDDGRWNAPGVWTGLNHFTDNYHGPYLLEWSINILNDKNFISFRRKDDKRWRYFFVQYEAKIPLAFRRNDKLWRRVSAESYFFDTKTKGLWLNSNDIYSIILTEELSLNNVRISAVNHPYCVSKKCKGKTQEEANKMLEKVGRMYIYANVKEIKEYKKLLHLFKGLKIKGFK